MAQTGGFQTYLNSAQTQTGHSPRRFLALAEENGFNSWTKFSEVVSWLKQDYGLGHGLASNLAQLITKGADVCAERYNNKMPLDLGPVSTG